MIVAPHKVGWWDAPVAFWVLAEAIKHENYNFNVFMTLLGDGIDECFLTDPLNHLGSLKSTRKSNWNYGKIKTTWKWKYDLRKTFQIKPLIYLRPTSAVTLVNVSLWPALAMYVA